MLFNRYKEVTDRCFELGAKMDTLTNEEGVELQRLLGEKTWLSKTIARNAKGALEEVKHSFDLINAWVGEAHGHVEQAIDQNGTPVDILALEKVIRNAAALRDKARDLMPGGKTKRDKDYPPGAEIRIDFIAGEEAGEIPEEALNSKQEIDAAAEEVAVAEVVAPEKAKPRTAVPLVEPPPPEPMTYRLSRDVVASLEEKLQPDLLTGPAFTLETGLPAPSLVKEIEKPKKPKTKKTKRKKR